jgi:hypothetical protein
MIETILTDLRYGAKMLWKSKGVTVVAVVSLAIGIGANSAIFSLVNSILLRPRPVSHPEQLVEIYVGEGEHPYHSTSYPSYVELRDRNEVLSGLAAYGIDQFKLGVADGVEQIWGEAVSGNYFDVLGVAAHKGRTFLSEEDLIPGKNPVTVISHSLWQRRFNSDRQGHRSQRQAVNCSRNCAAAIHGHDAGPGDRYLGSNDDYAFARSER